MDKSWNKSSGTFWKYIRDVKQRCFWTTHVNWKWTLFISLQCRHILSRRKLVPTIFNFMTEEWYSAKSSLQEYRHLPIQIWSHQGILSGKRPQFWWMFFAQKCLCLSCLFLLLTKTSKQCPPEVSTMQELLVQRTTWNSIFFFKSCNSQKKKETQTRISTQHFYWQAADLLLHSIFPKWEVC